MKILSNIIEVRLHQIYYRSVLSTEEKKVPNLEGLS